MSVRDFMRGGYRDIKEPTIITKHGRPVGTWLPPFVGFTFTDPRKVGTGETTKTSSR